MKPIDPEKTLLLCIDMQPVFVRVVAESAAVLGRCQFAVAAASGLGLPVLFTEQVPHKLGSTDASLLALCGRPEVYAKEAFSAFGSGCAVARRAEELGVRHVLLCGIETSVCVFQTANDILRRDLRVTILSDAVSARRPADARACLDALARDGAQVLPSESVFYSILGSASHPFFRTYTELVKKHA
jgi:nicotinamidase-related amidase